METFLKNWQTSIIGLALIIAGIILIIIGKEDLGSIAIMSGIGLAAAKTQWISGKDSKTISEIKNE